MFRNVRNLQCTRIPMTRLNVSFILQNFSQCTTIWETFSASWGEKIKGIPETPRPSPHHGIECTFGFSWLLNPFRASTEIPSNITSLERFQYWQVAVNFSAFDNVDSFVTSSRKLIEKRNDHSFSCTNTSHWCPSAFCGFNWWHSWNPSNITVQCSTERFQDAGTFPAFDIRR